MKNYFEHDVEVRYCDGLLEHSTNWAWFIEEIEKEFEGFKNEIETWDDFVDSYIKIKEIYSHLIKINAITGVSHIFSKNWLSQINNISLLFNGKKTIAEILPFLDCDFLKLFSLIVYTTKLQNTSNAAQFIYSSQIYIQHNIFELYDLSKAKDNEVLIYRLFDEIHLKDKDKLKSCLKSNLDKIRFPANIKLLEDNRDKLLNTHAFNFKGHKLPEATSWEEQYIFDMLGVKIKDREIVPKMVFAGVSNPNISLWTEDILNHLNEYFSNEIASFVIETIRYVLHKAKPSNQTISWHFKLVTEELGKHNSRVTFHQIECSSLCIIQYLLKDKLIDESIKEKFIKDYLNEVQKFEDPKTISKLKANGCFISNLQKEMLNSYEKNRANSIDELIEPYQFINYCKDEFVVDGMENLHLDKTITIFNNLIKEDNSAIISSLFYEFMKLLMRLLNNTNIDKAKLKNAMIELQLMWEKEYYDKCVSLMSRVGTTFTITNEEIKKTNELYFSSPIAIAFSCMPISHERILQSMATCSEHVLSFLCQRITITKTFPLQEDKKLERHDVDIVFTQIIEELLKNKGYKLLNYVEPKILFGEIYEDYKNRTRLNMTFFNQVGRLYSEIKGLLSDYDLIELENEKVYLAHLVQLFPILENKIREFGMYFNIVPFKEKEDEFLKMKDASNVLQQILVSIYEESGDLINVVDFFFIYQCLYNGNFLNIRNECVHGRDYISGDSLVFGFKVTLLCLKLIQNRLNRLER